MQLIWVSGPTGKLIKISISGRRLTTLALSICTTLLLLGACLYFMGIRVAVQVEPELIRVMGGVISESEQMRVEAEHKNQLEKLALNLSALSTQVERLKKIKEQFSELATPTIFKIKPNDFNNQGGPSQPLASLLATNSNFSKDASTVLRTSSDILFLVESLNNQWDDEYKLLKTLPTGEPLSGKKEISSTFGMRIDPFHRGLAFHSGVDFNAALGTPILAAGDGIVSKVDYNESYGNYIEILHRGELISKYAHATSFTVQEGQRVIRGEQIGFVGNTGRSTGPHLHFEVMRAKTFVDPMRVLLTAKKQTAAKD
jgi:murein DD-endopeptidase MepM/ murein hydrolase activator NlpD